MVVLSMGVGCAKQTERKAARPVESKPAASAQVPATPVASPPVASGSREVPFDGGVAHVETDARGYELVRLVTSDGGSIGESTCVPPLAGYDSVRAFYTNVRAAILGGDVEQVAAFIAFPLRVNDSRTRVVSTREQFVRERARILTPDVVKRVREADPGQVFCNSQGEMLGDGVLWAELQPSDRLAVWVINVGPERSGPARVRPVVPRRDD